MEKKMKMKMLGKRATAETPKKASPNHWRTFTTHINGNMYFIDFSTFGSAHDYMQRNRHEIDIVEITLYDDSGILRYKIPEKT